jgi:hypothetical protein
LIRQHFPSNIALQQKLLTAETICFRLQVISGAAAHSGFRARRAKPAPFQSSGAVYPMSEHPMRGFVRAFCDALAAREPARIAR